MLSWMYFYDGYRAQDLFDSCFERDGDKWIFTCHEGIDDLKKEYKLADGKKLKDFLLLACRIQYPNSSLYDAFKEVKMEFFDNCKWSELSFDDIYDYLTDSVFYCEHGELYDELNDNYYSHLKAGDFLVKNYDVIRVRGYNQGDEADILVFDEVQSLFGKGFDFNEMFVNLFYDAPISGTININGEEVNVNQFLNDDYEWNEQEFLINFISYCKYLKSYRTIKSFFKNLISFKNPIQEYI